MKWVIHFLSSSLGKKVIMALTGFFLILFLIVHLIGNLQLLKDDGGHSFNIYAEFMSTNPLIQLISKVNFFLITIHVVWALVLTLQNRRARGPKHYAKKNTSSHSTSRNMGILGFLILIFIVIHLRHFYAEVHWGGIGTVTYDQQKVRDVYNLVVFWFHKGWYVGLYVFCMLALAFHLWHGFESAFQSLGIHHAKYNPIIGFVSKAFSIIVPTLFASIPIIMFINQ